MNKSVKPFNYSRAGIEPGILHIGVGNFHRAHEEYYTNLLLSDPDQAGWGIAGAMLLPGDERLFSALESQKGEYTLTVCGRDGKDEVSRIGSLVEVMWAPATPEHIIDRIADPKTRIISMTITEGGYNMNRQTGDFLLDTPAIKADIENPRQPSTVFGFVAEGLRRRMDAGSGPVTILSCDNLQHNGDTARRAFMSFFNGQDPRLCRWAQENVSFPNSMVDRITPSTTPADALRLNRENGTDDKAPVYCEDFIQWVIEDDFKAGRPAWERVGVQFTDDVAPFENMKLSLLNASHTLLSYPAFLSGYRKVDEAMADDRIVKFVRQFMDIDITPYVPAPPKIDLDQYKHTLIERFANKAVSDQVARLCFDGISKFPVYIMPNLKKMLADGRDITREAYLIAAYRRYLKFRRDDNGQPFEIAEPWMTDADRRMIENEDPLDFLSMSAFAGVQLASDRRFVDKYLDMVDQIDRSGAMSTLESIL